MIKVVQIASVTYTEEELMLARYYILGTLEKSK